MKRIGVFDSGVGGLTVVKEIRKNFPFLDIIYLGDTARLPYGDKSFDTIIEYSISNTKFLLKCDVEMVIVACNTSSAIAIETLKKMFNLPFLGMIEASSKLALKKTKNKRIGLIGTRATILSGAYRKEILSLDKKVKIFEKETPLFVPIVEEGMARDEVAKIVSEKYLTSLIKKKIDTLILGCTHYPLLIPILKSIMPSVKMVHSGEATVDALKEDYSIEKREGKGILKVYVTDITGHFKSVAKKLLGEKIELEHIPFERMTKCELMEEKMMI